METFMQATCVQKAVTASIKPEAGLVNIGGRLMW